jgi:hypothetical protein
MEFPWITDKGGAALESAAPYLSQTISISDETWH